MHRYYRVLLPMLLVSCAAHAGEPQNIECQAESRVYFSNTTDPDHIFAEIRGAYCEDAVFQIVITDSAGERIFEREIPMSLKIPCSWLREKPERARRVYTGIVNGAVSLKRISELRCGTDDRHCSTSPAAERLRKHSAPAVCFHPNEATLCFAYDPEEGQVVEVHRRGT